ncbi:MAG: uncharacterized protein QOH41_3079 [Blastocatellia bacterium]|nr:uncharacterized protein [Blastocatellia bacterium]
MLKTKMMRKLVSLFMVTCSLIAVPLIVAQQEAPQFKLVQFHMALFKKGPKWEATPLEQRNQILQQHFANVLSLLSSGKAIVAGPMGDDTDLAGIFILRAASADEAKTWVDRDPAVTAGLFTSEMHPWFSEDIFKKANSPLKLNTVYLALLKKGPNRKEGDGETAAVQELQKAHLANINRLAEMKKLIVAGPFGDDGVLRGIFVFRVASLQEAQDLCATDPMIKIGRLAVELHPWQVPEGVLP